MIKKSSPVVLPGAPTGLVAIAIGGCQVILAWTECGGDGLGFRIERADRHNSNSSFVEIGQVGPHVTAFCDVSVKPRKTYSYRVHARNAFGDSPPSNVVEVTTPQDEKKRQAD